MTKARFLFLLLIIYPRTVKAADDKALHVGSSLVISYFATWSLCELGYKTPTLEIGGFTFTLGVGAAKELYDERFDGDDMLANTGGAVLGTSLARYTVARDCTLKQSP